MLLRPVVRMMGIIASQKHGLTHLQMYVQYVWQTAAYVLLAQLNDYIM